MTTINHHLSDDILMAYAAGALPEAFDLVVATHISLCDECRAQLAGYEAVGGAVIDGTEAAALSDTCLEQTLKLIAGGPKDPIRTEAPKHDAVLPGPLRDYVGGDIGAVKWRPAGGGVRHAVLPTAKGATVRLLAIPGGVKIPDHGHRGTEMTLVLQGAFVDEHDRFGRGDVEIANEEMVHTPVAEPGETCICLAATDAPLRFQSWLPRIVQPFVGI